MAIEFAERCDGDIEAYVQEYNKEGDVNFSVCVISRDGRKIRFFTCPNISSEYHEQILAKMKKLRRGM